MNALSTHVFFLALYALTELGSRQHGAIERWSVPGLSIIGFLCVFLAYLTEYNVCVRVIITWSDSACCMSSCPDHCSPVENFSGRNKGNSETCDNSAVERSVLGSLSRSRCCSEIQSVKHHPAVNWLSVNSLVHLRLHMHSEWPEDTHDDSAYSLDFVIKGCLVVGLWAAWGDGYKGAQTDTLPKSATHVHEWVMMHCQRKCSVTLFRTSKRSRTFTLCFFRSGHIWSNLECILSCLLSVLGQRVELWNGVCHDEV